MRRILRAVLIGISVLLLGSTAVAFGAERPARTGDVELIVRYKDVVFTREATQADIEFTVLNLAQDRVLVGLDVVGVPEDWTANIRQQAGDYQVEEVALGPQAQASLSLRLGLPGELSSGIKRLQLQATSPAGQVVARQTVSVGIALEEVTVVSEGVNLSAVYPSVAGPPSQVFEFEVILSNRTGARNTFSLITEAPPGWEAIVVPIIEQDKVISGVSVVKGGLHVLQVRVSAPAKAEPGSYPIKFAAWLGDARDEVDLVVVVKGTGELSGTTEDGLLSLVATAGKELLRVYKVTNTGTDDILGISLLSNPPSGWEVTLEPKIIELLPPGEGRDVAVTIKPGANAVPGDYAVLLAAVNPETTHTMLLRVDVKHSTLWRWFGLAALVFVVASLMGLYARLNRR